MGPLNDTGIQSPLDIGIIIIYVARVRGTHYAAWRLEIDMEEEKSVGLSEPHTANSTNGSHNH